MLRIALAVIRNRDSEVLIIRRKKVEKNSDGIVVEWVFPGGKIEPGETAQEAAAREASEETGYAVKCTNCIVEAPHPQFPVHISFYEGQIVETGESLVVNPEEVVEQRWVKPSDLNRYFTTEVNAAVLSYLGIDE